jgi:Na+-transporting NADH:ubiquinone oxidoreductase subunit C
MYSNRYVTIYTLVMTLIVSVILAIIVTGLKPSHDANEAVFKKREILLSIKDQLDGDLMKMSTQEILSLFDSKIEQVVLDANGKPMQGLKAEDIDMAKEEKKPKDQRQYPMYIFTGDQGKLYLMSVRGNGLWDKVWGTIALKDDLNTVAGASFGHVAETPGLGAEIKDNPNFPKAFIGKTIFDGDKYVSVAVVKGGVKNPNHEIDGISGATITSRGVSDMIYAGIEVYLPYLLSLKTQTPPTQG